MCRLTFAGGKTRNMLDSSWEELIPVTYEGKRKQNFDKKALELESSTQQLQEQMKAEEQAKRDKQRQVGLFGIASWKYWNFAIKYSLIHIGLKLTYKLNVLECA